MVEDLITNNARHLETLLAGNRIDNQVAMDANKVLRIKNTILILEQSVSVSVGSMDKIVSYARLLDGRWPKIK